MGYYVHLSVTFSIEDKETLSQLAAECLEHLDTRDATHEAEEFLQDCVTGRGYVRGHKGALYTWGIVGNHSRADCFINDLLPFWDGLLGKSKDCGLDFEHVIVFYEPEETGHAQCYEIYRESLDIGYGDIQLKHHDLPFCWNQY